MQAVKRAGGCTLGQIVSNGERNMKMRQMLASGVVALVLLAVSAIGAEAGSNGQQLEITTGAASVYVSGTNQLGNPYAKCFALPYFTTYLTGYWWKGTTSMDFYYNSNCTSYEAHDSTNVPVNQSSNYWYVEEPF
jgi:hypothetical protein